MHYPPIRRERLIPKLGEAKVDALLVTNPLNVHYLTGFTGDSSFVIIMPERTILVSDTRFAVQIKQDCPDLETAIRGPAKTTWQEAVDVLGKLGARSIGVESQHLTISSFGKLKELAPDLEFAPTKDLVEDLRRIKDSSEIAAIQAAIDWGNRAFSRLKGELAPNCTEKALADAMDGHIRQAGGRGSSFETIVAIGERSALPHAIPSECEIGEAGFFLLDWGAKGRYYTSDLTRVVRSPFSGPRVETELEKIYTVVLQAQKQAIAAVRPGVAAKDVDAVCRSVIAEAGYGERFNHGLGHGIGLQVHEAPDIRSTSTDVLQAGMVFTIEPGIYIEGLGGVRLEDDVLVTPDGCRVLSADVPKGF
jgi:Xaa-Pro aminopeptidase